MAISIIIVVVVPVVFYICGHRPIHFLY
jgi:hypothetical protein